MPISRLRHKLMRQQRKELSNFYVSLSTSCLEFTFVSYINHNPLVDVYAQTLNTVYHVHIHGNISVEFSNYSVRVTFDFLLQERVGVHKGLY